ncbi:hypothetical protein WMO79_01230 [Micrococcaceae bacterium Sec7.4]
MSVQIVGYKTVTALPADTAPEMDCDGYPTDRTITRAYTPTRYPHAMDGLPGGHDEDPLEPGFLGSHWYRLGDAVGSTFDMSSSRLTEYRDELMDFSTDLSESAPFYDLIHFDASDGMIGPDACKRLADAFRKYPYVQDQSQVHEELRGMIHEVAEHGGCLVFEG